MQTINTVDWSTDSSLLVMTDEITKTEGRESVYEQPSMHENTRDLPDFVMPPHLIRVVANGQDEGWRYNHVGVGKG
jgi:hypothetical protein